MLVEEITAPHIRMTDALVSVETYTDGSLCLMAADLDDDGNPNVETFSTNLGAYGKYPDAGCVFIKDEAEAAGLTAELERLGVGTIISTTHYGPFNTRAYVFQLADTLTEGML